MQIISAEAKQANKKTTSAKRRGRLSLFLSREGKYAFLEGFAEAQGVVDGVFGRDADADGFACRALGKSKCGKGT